MKATTWSGSDGKLLRQMCLLAQGSRAFLPNRFEVCSWEDFLPTLTKRVLQIEINACNVKVAC